MKTKLFLRFFLSFAVIYFLVIKFVPFLKIEKLLSYLIIQTLIISVFYAIFMTWFSLRKKKNEEK
jgi:hypothetical protein